MILVILLTGGNTMPNVVGIKGQVVISKEIRDRLGVKPGWVSMQKTVEDHLEMHFYDPAGAQSLKGSLAGHIKRRLPPGAEWENGKRKAWARAAKDKIGVSGKGR
jgi:bifunctional DNA-binding transcriptional regulator/antitoxin component of YhaV-PrlF toxin-antitoxin module